jgi:hypothetical protein
MMKGEGAVYKREVRKVARMASVMYSAEVVDLVES